MLHETEQTYRAMNPANRELKTTNPLDALRPRHQRFVAEFLIDRNATAAYQRAGYVATRAAAGRNAYRLLKNADIQAVLKLAEDELLDRVRLRQTEIHSALRDVVTSDITHYLIDEDGAVTLAPGVDKSAMRAISSIHKKTIQRTRGDGTETVYEVKITLWNKMEALRMAAQTQGMLKPENPAESDPQQAESNYFQRLIQIAQQREITSEIGAESFRSPGRKRRTRGLNATEGTAASTSGRDEGKHVSKKFLKRLKKTSVG